MSIFNTRTATVVALAAGALVAPTAAQAAPPVAHQGTFNGGNKPFVNVRSAPSSTSTLVRRVRSGAPAFIVCQTTGGMARGPYGRSRIWNKLRAGGYASDTRVYTGSDQRVAPECGSGPQPGPAPAPSNDPFRYDDAGPYNGGAGCTNGYTAGALVLKSWLTRTYPNTAQTIGGFNCRPNTADTSQTSLHGVGRALDWMADVGDPGERRAVDRFIARVLRDNARLARAMGIQELIWNRRIWTVNYRYWRPYSADPHTDHIHIGINLLGARKQTSFYR